MTRIRGRARVTVVTSGHLSTCPRMLKSADALAADGYDVRVIATRHEPWAAETDRDVASRRSWTADVDRPTAAATAARPTGGPARATARRGPPPAALGPARAPLGVVARAFGRVHSELVRAIAADPGDLIYGGTTGALAADRRSGAPHADAVRARPRGFSRGETAGADAPLVDALALRVERAVLPGAVFVTDGERGDRGGVPRARRRRRRGDPQHVPAAAAPPDVSRADPSRLRVYWFSQTIGPGRGLEDAIAALGRAGVRGAADAARAAARRLPRGADRARGGCTRRASRSCTCRRRRPTRWSICARGYDVGLALEQMTPRNRQLCLTNKAFTYILAGMAVAMTDTPGQHALGVDLGRAAALVPRGRRRRAGGGLRALGGRSGGARLRQAHRVARRDAALALGARRGARPAARARPRGARVRILLLMDPFIKVPPDHYGGIERVVADLADRLTRRGHDVTLWAAPGSRVDGARRAVRPRRGVDALEQRPQHADAGRPVPPRAAPLRRRSTTSAAWRISTPVLRARRAEGADLHAHREPGQHGDRAAARRAAAALHRGQRRDSRHRPPGRRRLVGDLQLRRAGALSLRRRHRSGDGAARLSRPARPLQGRAPRDHGRAPSRPAPDHRRQHLAAARTSRRTSTRRSSRTIDGELVTYIGPVGDAAKQHAARRGGGDAAADRVGGAVPRRAAGVDAVRHAAHRVPPRRRARRDRPRAHRLPLRHGRRDDGARRAAARDRPDGRARRSRAPFLRRRRSPASTSGCTTAR